MADIIKSRRDTAENWRTANPTLAEGELGFETDTKRYKLGDGKTEWNSLSYFDRDVDKLPTENSEKLVTSGGVYEAFHNEKFVDDKPTEGSGKVVSSGGVEKCFADVNTYVNNQYIKIEAGSSYVKKSIRLHAGRKYHVKYTGQGVPQFLSQDETAILYISNTDYEFVLIEDAYFVNGLLEGYIEITSVDGLPNMTFVEKTNHLEYPINNFY